MKTFKQSECRRRAEKARRIQIGLVIDSYKREGCSVCGYKRCQRALEFHHLNGTEKEWDVGIGSGWRSKAKLRRELEKCILVCANCHREIHEGMTVVRRWRKIGDGVELPFLKEGKE